MIASLTSQALLNLPHIENPQAVLPNPLPETYPIVQKVQSAALPLIESCKLENKSDLSLEFVKFYIVKGAEINKLDRNGWSALHYAAQAGLLDVVQLLIDNGADIHLADSSGTTALHIAAANGRLKIVELLVAMGANINSINNVRETPLYMAVTWKRLEVAKYLLEQEGININQPNHNRDTPLHAAAWAGQLEIAQLLIEKGAIRDHANCMGETARSYAMSTANTAMIELLGGDYRHFEDFEFQPF